MKKTRQPPPVGAQRPGHDHAPRDEFTMPQFMGANAVGWILTALVLLLLFVNGAVLRKPLVLLLTGNRTTGVVVGWHEEDAVKAPVVEFTARAGARVRVTGRVSTAAPSVREGDVVTVFYRASDPGYAQILLRQEFMATAVLLGFTGFLVVFWMVMLMVTKDPGLGDPLHLLPRLVRHARLNPVRFPQLFVLVLVIPGCALAANALFRRAAEMRASGITVTGHVTGSHWDSSRLRDGNRAGATFPMIDYQDSSGATHSIRRSLAWPLSRLHTGDAVDVVYLARQPEQGIVDTWDERYLVPLFFAAMMLGFLFVFVMVLRGRYG